VGLAIATLTAAGWFSGTHAIAGASSPLTPVPPPDPGGVAGGPYYVNDHTFVRGPDGAWHLFGIFHHEPIGDDSEFELIHAVAPEPDPARWDAGAFEPAAPPYTVALQSDGTVGETHLWAPHVIAAEGRYFMIYQGGGPADRASMRLAESDDLYRWVRTGSVPLFEDICVARDPMVVRRDNAWVLYYTRCDSTARRVSGVAYRVSKNLVDWSEPHMVLTLEGTPPMANSGFTESPFVFERNGYYYLSVTPYPVAWDATFVYRSPAPFAFPSVPYTRLRAHAAEWVSSADGASMFVSHAGPGQSGVWLAPVPAL
jgi:hypothetical protein